MNFSIYFLKIPDIDEIEYICFENTRDKIEQKTCWNENAINVFTYMF